MTLPILSNYTDKLHSNIRMMLLVQHNIYFNVLQRVRNPPPTKKKKKKIKFIKSIVGYDNEIKLLTGEMERK